MNKLKKLIDERNITPTGLSKMIGKPARSTDIAKWISTDRSLFSLPAESVFTLSRILGVDVTELLSEADLDGTTVSVKNLNSYVGRIRVTFGVEGTDFEIFNYVGKRLKFEAKDAISCLRHKGVDVPKNAVVGNTEARILSTDPDYIIMENAKIDKAFKDRLYSFQVKETLRSDPAYCSYTERDGVKTLVAAAFRESKRIIERVEVVKAVWSDEDPDAPWAKVYGDVLYGDFMDFKDKVEESPITFEEYFELLAKLVLGMGVAI